MNVLKPVAIRSGATLAAVVAESLAGIEPGLSLLDRDFAAPDARVDLLAVDGRRHLVLIIVDAEADTATVVRALEVTAWCREHAALLARMFPRADVDPAAEVRAIVVASRLSERSLRALRALGAALPRAVECRAFELDGERCVSYTTVGEAAAHEARGGGGPSGEPEAAPPAIDAVGTPPVPAPIEPPRPAEPAPAERAQHLIARLEALRFRQAFQ